MVCCGLNTSIFLCLKLIKLEMKNIFFNKIKQFFIRIVVARFYCFFFGHSVSEKKICGRCKIQFGVPKMKSPPKPP